MLGMRVHLIKGGGLFHQEMDLVAPCSTPVCSADNGKIIEAYYSRDYGQFVHVRHAEGYSTLYAHTSRLYVKTGIHVRIEQHIGNIGHTGAVTDSRLHFELRKDGVLLDPFSRLPFR